MATDRLPLHLCNSIKQYTKLYQAGKEKINSSLKKELEQLTINVKRGFASNPITHLKIEYKKQVTTLRDKFKFILLLMLVTTNSASANSYSGGGKNSMLRTRIIGTRYGKLQGVILPMDQHKYLKPVEAYLGVPYATPPTGSNR